MTDTISNDLSWLKHHIVLLVIVIVLVGASVYGIESIIARHDAVSSAKADIVLQQQTAQTNLLATKLQQDEQLSAQQNAQLMAMNAQLSSYITQRDKAAAIIVQKDATLSALEAAQKITVQTKAQPGEVVVQGDTVQMDLSVSRTVVANQDQLPVVQADLTDAKTEIRQGETVIENLQTVVLDGRNTIDSMKTQAVDADRACKAEVATVKAQARKSKLKWFLTGLITGIIGGRYI